MKSFQLILCTLLVFGCLSQEDSTTPRSQTMENTIENTTPESPVTEETTIEITPDLRGNDDALTDTTQLPTEPPSTNCTDVINPKTGKSDCVGVIGLCKKEKYVAFMKKICPATCGYCIPTKRIIPKQCRDLYSMCPRYKRLCTNSRSGAFIRLNCPFTCGICGNSTGPARVRRSANDTPPECKDAATIILGNKKCYQMKTLCSLEMMKRECAATCGYCIQMREKVCKDQISAMCKKSLCQGSPVVRDYMEEVCPATCGLCDKEMTISLKDIDNN